MARSLAEAHRQHISRWFYDRAYDQHRGLAETYVTDPSTPPRTMTLHPASASTYTMRSSPMPTVPDSRRSRQIDAGSPQASKSGPLSRSARIRGR